MTSLNNVLATPPVDGWPDDPLPLVAELPHAKQFPMDALPPVLAEYGHIILHCIQAPDALIGNSLLAAASLAVQAHANVTLPHGAIAPVSLYFVSIAESGDGSRPSISLCYARTICSRRPRATSGMRHAACGDRAA